MCLCREKSEESERDDESLPKAKRIVRRLEHSNPRKRIQAIKSIEADARTGILDSKASFY